VNSDDVASGCREAWGAGEGSHVDCGEAVVNDVKSNVGMVVVGELKLREAGL